MAVTYKRLGAAAGNGTIGTAAQLYAASSTAGTSTVVSSVVVCNTGAASTFTVAVNTASATYAAGEYVAYQAPIAANDTVTLTLGLVLDSVNRFLNVSSAASTVNFSAFGVENS